MMADVFNGMADSLQRQIAEASRERQRLEAAMNASIDGYAAVDQDLMVLFAATVAAAGTLVLVTGGLASVILVPAFWIWTGRTLRR